MHNKARPWSQQQQTLAACSSTSGPKGVCFICRGQHMITAGTSSRKQSPQSDLVWLSNGNWRYKQCAKKHNTLLYDCLVAVARSSLHTLNSLDSAVKSMAIKRFTSLEGKLNKSPVLKAQYVAFLDEYLQLGNM